MRARTWISEIGGSADSISDVSVCSHCVLIFTVKLVTFACARCEQLMCGRCSSPLRFRCVYACLLTVCAILCCVVHIFTVLAVMSNYASWVPLVAEYGDTESSMPVPSTPAHAGSIYDTLTRQTSSPPTSSSPRSTVGPVSPAGLGGLSNYSLYDLVLSTDDFAPAFEEKSGTKSVASLATSPGAGAAQASDEKKSVHVHTPKSNLKREDWNARFIEAQSLEDSPYKDELLTQIATDFIHTAELYGSLSYAIQFN